MSDPAAQFVRTAPGVRSAELLHAGTYLHIYAAHLDDRSEPVRIVTLAPQESVPAVRSAFERVAADWRDLGTHPNVVTVHASDETPRPWLALDAAGTPLTDLDIPLSVAESTQVLADTAEGLRAALRAEAGGLGLGPDTVRVVRSAGELTARIEFDLERVCRIAAGERPLSPETPPEQLDSPEESDERSAVYRLGAVAFTALTGDPLVLSEGTTETAIRTGALRPLTAVDPTISRAVGDVVWTALALDPADRYQSPYEFKLAVLFDAREPTPSTGQPQSTGAVGQPAPDNRIEESGPAAEPSEATADMTGDAGGGGDDASDGSSFLSRRQALGALGIGTVGIVTGGAWLSSGKLGGGDHSVPTYQYDSENTGFAPDLSGPTSGVTAEWAFETGGPVISSPAVVDGTVYVGSDDGSIYALGAETGEKQWSTETEDRVSSSPAVVDGTVYIRNWAGSTYALDAADGSRQWVNEGDDGRRGYVIPVVADGTVYTPTSDGLAALDTADGSEQWTAAVPAPQSLSLALADGTLYYGTTDGLLALDGANGRELWHANRGSTSFPSPTVVDGVVYSGDRDHGIYALETATGDERWVFETNETVWSSPAVTDAAIDSDGTSSGRTSYGASANTVYALDAAGEELWRVETEGSLQASPVVVDGALYVGDNSGYVYALDASTGDELWRFETDNEVLSSAAVVDGTVYVGGIDGSVYALTEP
jgi:outer membrane protein assembly factor BamB